MTTRAAVEYLLIQRTANLMTAAGLDPTIQDGTNEHLSEPISSACLQMGVTPTDLTNPSDTDLSGITDVAQLLDRAHLRLCENILGNLAMVDITAGPRSENLSQLGTQVQAIIGQLTAKIQRLYGDFVGSLEAGVVGLDFAQKYSDTEFTGV